MVVTNVYVSKNLARRLLRIKDVYYTREAIQKSFDRDSQHRQSHKKNKRDRVLKMKAGSDNNSMLIFSCF